MADEQCVEFEKHEDKQLLLIFTLWNGILIRNADDMDCFCQKLKFALNLRWQPIDFYRNRDVYRVKRKFLCLHNTALHYNSLTYVKCWNKAGFYIAKHYFLVVSLVNANDLRKYFEVNYITEKLLLNIALLSISVMVSRKKMYGWNNVT